MGTKYRTINDGYKDLLQYLCVRKILFIKITYWKYIWCPYYDSTYGRSFDSTMSDTYVCSYNYDFKRFKGEWSNIKDYFKWAKKEQTRLKDVALKKQEEIDKNKGTVKYL